MFYGPPTYSLHSFTVSFAIYFFNDTKFFKLSFEVIYSHVGYPVPHLPLKNIRQPPPLRVLLVIRC